MTPTIVTPVSVIAYLCAIERLAERERIAAALDDYAKNYPIDVFPPASDSRDAIGGTAMRHAYRNAARIARGEE